MVVFGRQSYFAQMKWGDESNKKWFKINQPPTFLIEIKTLALFEIFQGSPKEEQTLLVQFFLIRRLSKLSMLRVYFPFLASLVVFIWTKEPLWFSQIPSRLLCSRNTPFSLVVPS